MSALSPKAGRRSRWTATSRNDKEELAMEKGRCNASGCGKPEEARGLCKTCYHATRVAIREGRVTEEQLVEMKLYSPRKRSASPVLRAIEEWQLQKEREAAKPSRKEKK